MKPGDSATVSRAFSAQDALDYATLAGLSAPPAITPEPLISGLFSYLLGVKLPGRGTNYLKQSLLFHRPVALDQRIVAHVTVTRLRPEKHLADLATKAFDDSGNLVCEGRALVYTADVNFSPSPAH